MSSYAASSSSSMAASSSGSAAPSHVNDREHDQGKFGLPEEYISLLASGKTSCKTMRIGFTDRISGDDVEFVIPFHCAVLMEPVRTYIELMGLTSGDINPDGAPLDISASEVNLTQFTEDGRPEGEWKLADCVVPASEAHKFKTYPYRGYDGSIVLFEGQELKEGEVVVNRRVPVLRPLGAKEFLVVHDYLYYKRLYEMKGDSVGNYGDIPLEIVKFYQGEFQGRDENGQPKPLKDGIIPQFKTPLSRAYEVLYLSNAWEL